MSPAGDDASSSSWGAAPPNPRTGREEVHVWRAPLVRTPREVERLRGLLSADEVLRAGRFHFERDRAAFVVARGTLRELLGLYLGVAPRLPRFSHNAYGKPYLPEDAPLRFNLSHSGGLALYAFAEGREVGVDVEAVREDVDCSELAGSFFSPAEVKALTALPAGARTRAFYECWARKEAYIKGRGRGLSLPLDSFDVSLAPGEPAALLATRDDEREAARWSLRELSAGEGYAAALAVEGAGARLRLWRWPADGVDVY